MSDERLAKIYEDRLLDRTGMYRLVYWIAVVLAATMFISWVLIQSNFEKFDDPDIANFSFGATCFFALACRYAHAKLSHIQTIRRYRQQLPSNKIIL